MTPTKRLDGASVLNTRLGATLNSASAQAARRELPSPWWRTVGQKPKPLSRKQGRQLRDWCREAPYADKGSIEIQHIWGCTEYWLAPSRKRPRVVLGCSRVIHRKAPKVSTTGAGREQWRHQSPLKATQTSPKAEALRPFTASLQSSCLNYKPLGEGSQVRWDFQLPSSRIVGTNLGRDSAFRGGGGGESVGTSEIWGGGSAIRTFTPSLQLHTRRVGELCQSFSKIS